MYLYIHIHFYFHFSNQFLIERIVLSNTSTGSGDWRGEEGWWQWYWLWARGRKEKLVSSAVGCSSNLFVTTHQTEIKQSILLYTCHTAPLCSRIERGRGESWWDPVLILTFLGSVTNQEWRGNSSANHFHVLPDVDIPWLFHRMTSSILANILCLSLWGLMNNDVSIKNG